jgi:histidinol-phosphate aminotransferase
VTSASIVTGCGSDDVLDAAFRAFGEPGASLAYCPPTFSIIPSLARVNGLRPLPLPLSLTALRAADPALIYLCAPNNPTGALLPEGFVETLLESTRGVLVLDEAYIDYADATSLVAAAPGLERLLVVRTLSKAWGLAGLRVGYAVGAPLLISELEKTRGPFKVGGLAELAAVAVLAVDGPWVQREIEAVRAGRAAFAQALRTRGFDPLPSQANFVLVPVPKDAEAVAARMRERGVSVRAFSRLVGIGEALRISIGPAPWMRACLTALEEAVQ